MLAGTERCVRAVRGMGSTPPKGGGIVGAVDANGLEPRLGWVAWSPVAPSPALALSSLDIPVVLTRPLEPKAGRELQSVVLSCDFRPAPRAVQWYKEDTPLAPSEKFKMALEGQMAELRILRLTPADAGLYRCQAGNAQSSAKVTVEGREPGRRAGQWAPLQGKGGWLVVWC